MKIYRSLVKPSKPLPLDEDIDFSDRDFAKDYPLLGIEGAHIKGVVESNGGILTVNATFKGTLILSDSYDLKPFGLPIEEKEIIPLLSDITSDSDGYFFPENVIELSEVVYSFLRSFVPIKPLRPGSKPVKYDEEEAGEESSGGSPFDVLLETLDDEK